MKSFHDWFGQRKEEEDARVSIALGIGRSLFQLLGHEPLLSKKRFSRRNRELASPSRRQATVLLSGKMGGFWDVTDSNQVCSLWASGGMLYWQEYWVKESLFPAGSSQWERAGFFTCTGGWELWTLSSEIHSADIPNLGTAAENIQFNTYWLGPLLMCWFCKSWP